MRTFVAFALGAAVGIFAFPAGMALTGSSLAATLIAGGAAIVVGLWTYRRPIVPLDEPTSRGLKIVSAVATVVALVQLARLAVFTVAPSEVGYSFIPGSDWEVHHSCFSAYYVAARASSSTSNIYADSLYTRSDDDPTGPRKARVIGPFKIDVFEYPPPFLLLPRALRLLTPDFLRSRMVWFALDGGLVLLALLIVARLLSPTAGRRALLLSPLVWAALPTISTLQKGNAQAMVIAASMLAMVLFERRRWAAGGAVLAFVTVSKLYPGLLVFYLIARRQWRAAAWTAAFGIAFVVLTGLDIGWATYAAFLDHLPGLVGGEAFPAFRNPAATAINFSVPGLVFKLKLFGVPGMNFGAAKVVGWCYTLVAVAVTILVGRRALRDQEKPLVWLAILIVATLRSPFLPQAYAAFPPLWLLTLLAAGASSNAWRLSSLLAAWSALNVFWPLDWAIDPRVLAIATLVPQAVTIGIAALVLQRAFAPQIPGLSSAAARSDRGLSTAASPC